MVQYGFCGGAAKPANTFYLFWQWAWPEGCRILRTAAPWAGREDAAGAVGHAAARPSGSRGGCWSCPCLQPLQPPCLHWAPMPDPAPGGAGWRLAPCKEGGEPVLSSPHSRAGFGVTQLFPSLAHSQGVGAQPQFAEPPSSRGRAHPHPAGFLRPNPRSAIPLRGQTQLKPARGQAGGQRLQP